MICSKDDFKLCQFQLQHLDQAADLITKEFLTRNKLWQSFQIQHAELLPIVRIKIALMVLDAQSFVLLDKNDNVVGTSFSIDIFYRDKLKNINSQYPITSSLPVFRFLAQIEEQLEQSIKQIPRIKGIYLFGTYATMDRKYEGSGIAAWFLQNCFLISKYSGLKGYFGRVTNELNLLNIILPSKGADEINQVNTLLPNGRNLTIYLHYVDLQNKYTPKL